MVHLVVLKAKCEASKEYNPNLHQAMYGQLQMKTGKGLRKNNSFNGMDAWGVVECKEI